jgi:hypothetical protein
MISCNSSSRFGETSRLVWVMPVMLLPGSFKLATRPSWIVSAPVSKTIGMVLVAALAASAAGVEVAAITVTCRCTSSFASVGSRSVWPSAQRYSIVTLRPST